MHVTGALDDQMGSKPVLLIKFDSELGEEESPTLMDPFDDNDNFLQAKASPLHHHPILQHLRGKRCLGCFHGEWLLMLDDATGDCFLVSLSTSTIADHVDVLAPKIIPLPPLVVDSTEPLHRCALSSPSPTSPDCTVIFASFCDSYLLCCRPGDEDWWYLDDGITFMGDIVGCRGKVYVPTDMSSVVMIDASSPSSSDDVDIAKRDIPQPSSMHSMQSGRLVESDGEVFLLQFYLYGARDSELLDMDIHRPDTEGYVWEKVEGAGAGIGDRAIFVGDNCVAVSNATRAGLRPGCVHLLHRRCHDGVRLYTVRLHDRATSFRLLPPGSCSRHDTLYWVLPPPRYTHDACSFNNKLVIEEECFGSDDDQVYSGDQQAVAPWCSLPGDMVEELVARISLIDYLHLRQVCKGWSRSITKPVQYTDRYQTYPMLMTICSNSYKLFDPIFEQEYTVTSNCKNRADQGAGSLVFQSQDYFQMLLFAKHGWVVVTRGEKIMYAMNPFNDVVDGESLSETTSSTAFFQFPELPFMGHQFDGISLSTAPTSPDCLAFSISKDRNPAGRNHSVYVTVWRAGDDHWTKLQIDDHTTFRTAYSNPVFHDGEFYCLGTRGGLGVFNPSAMTWRVLGKPEPVLPLPDDGDPMPGDMYCHLLEFREDLVAVFRPHGDGPISVFRLDRSTMAWTKMERLDDDDAVLFVDNWSAIMMPAPRPGVSCNMIYLPKFGRCNGAGDADKSAFYDLGSRKYCPSYYGLTDRLNSIWVQPKFRHHR